MVQAQFRKRGLPAFSVGGGGAALKERFFEPPA